ncbi:MAG: long-chain-fatty-acid--CoA ligase [Deltaproteobacteria bacterium]|nr:long-chain-fatty-acid--CoA ligase [Deltaproteobacteria bacterium]
MTIGDFIRQNALAYPDKLAVKSETRQLTFREFNARVNRLIGALQRRGVEKGERLCLLSNNSVEFLEVFGAAEKGGFVVVPLNWRLTAGELLTLVRDARPAALFVQERYLPRILEIREHLGDVRILVAIGGERPAGWEEFEAFVATGSEDEPRIEVSEDDPVYFIYTSGTTGTPRAAMHTHRSQLAVAREMIRLCGIRDDNVNVNVLPLFHIGGHSKRLPHSIAGALNLTVDSFDPVECLRLVEREKITFLHIVPSMVASLLEVPNLHEFDLGSLRTIFYAASPMPVELLRKALKVFGPIFMQGFGQSESGPDITCLVKQDHVDLLRDDGLSRLASAGRPIPGVAVEIRDADDRPLPPGSVGEICARSPYLMQGYWANEQASRETLRGGFLHTGDVGFLDEEGFLFVVDRKKDMIISGGENIYPREVEEVLYKHPGVLEATVIGVPDEKWVEAVKALVVLREGTSATEAELIDFCKAHLASYKKPRSVEFRTFLPKSPAGKILKRELREAYWPR